MPKLAAFDIEIATIIPDGETDYDKLKPLGIAVAIILPEDQEPLVWQSLQGADRLSRDEAGALATTLSIYINQGYRLVTWNGLGFDFKLLADESGLQEVCKSLALDHYDLMFQFFCQRGFCVGLDAAAKGMGFEGKTPGMSGAKAPRLWAEGKRWEVIQYCIQDCRLTLDLARKIADRRALYWVKKNGYIGSEPFPGLVRVLECLEMPEPNTSFIPDPWPRSKFSGWLQDFTK